MLIGVDKFATQRQISMFLFVIESFVIALIITCVVLSFLCIRKQNSRNTKKNDWRSSSSLVLCLH